MRIYFFLILFLILSAFGVGYFGFSFKHNYEPSDSDKMAIRSVRNKFVNSYKQVSTINLSSLFPSRRHLSLLQIDERKEDIFYTDKDCFQLINQIGQNFSEQKVLFWEKYRCGDISRLPGSFFSLPPYVHPSGYSYVYLFYRFKERGRVDKSWIFNHFEYIKTEEYQYFKDELGQIPVGYQLLASLKRDEMDQVARSLSAILTKDYLLLLDWDVFNFFERIYYVYEREDLENFLKDTSFTVAPIKKGKNCLVRDGGLCWNFSIAYLIERSGYTNLSIAVILIIFIAVSLFVIYSMISKEREEDEKRKFALRVLSHELRTPLAGMLLKLDALLGKVDQYDEYSQEKLLKISSDAHRLRRLIEMSRNYLTASHKNKKITKVNKQKIESIEDLIVGVLENYPEIEFKSNEVDCSIVTDEYWLQVILRNLVENAINHGRDPVEVSLNISKKAVKIEVKDAGTCNFNTLDEMAEEFRKGSKSEGTGLGLNIVQRMVKELGGKIDFEKSPTRFTLILNKDA